MPLFDKCWGCKPYVYPDFYSPISLSVTCAYFPIYVYHIAYALLRLVCANLCWVVFILEIINYTFKFMYKPLILKLKTAIPYLPDGVNLKDRNSLTGILQQVN